MRGAFKVFHVIHGVKVHNMTNNVGARNTFLVLLLELQALTVDLHSPLHPETKVFTSQVKNNDRQRQTSNLHRGTRQLLTP